jgi:hypothetical protein
LINKRWNGSPFRKFLLSLFLIPSSNPVLTLCVIVNRYLAQLATADPITRSSTPITEYLSRTLQHQIRKESRSMLPLYKVVLDSTDQFCVPPIWFLHRYKCVHTHIRFVHHDPLLRLLRFPSDGVLNFFSFIPMRLHTHLASCLFLFSRYHTTHMSKAILYTSVFFFLLATP